MIAFPEYGLTAPDGCIIGVIAEGRFELAERPGILHHSLAQLDAVSKAREVSRLLARARAGETIVLVSHDEPLLLSCADEIWWFSGGKLAGKGDPTEVLTEYRRYVARALRQSGDGIASQMSTERQGDGRAELLSIELLGKDSAQSIVWRSGEEVAIRVTVRFHSEIEDPVIGILIRTRIGLNVYGTNTELENIHFGPVKAGDTVRVTYRFRCELCNGDYTVTAASHDPDGTWHDWMDDAAAFTVADDRYTAGVANLRARVAAELMPRG